MQKDIDERKFKIKQESDMQIRENNAKPEESQNTNAEIDCTWRRVRKHLSMKTFRQMTTQIVLGKQETERVS